LKYNEDATIGLYVYIREYKTHWLYLVIKMIKSILVFFLLASTAFAAPKYSSGKNSYTKPSSEYTVPSKPSSGSSYSSGSKTYSSGVSKPEQSTPSSNASSHDYSSGSKKYSSSSTNEQKYSTSKKVESGSWYEDLSSSGKQKDSQDAYSPPEPYVPPKYEYKTPTGQTKEYDYSSVGKVRDKVDYEKYQQYDVRNQKTFDKYSTRPNTTTYNDAINIWFWLWLLDQSIDTQAEWVYHHKDEIDEVRYKEIIKNTPGIDVRLEAMEKAKKLKDPGFVPSSMENDADLQYNKDYVEQVIRPVKPIDWAAFGAVLWFGLKVLAVIAAVAIVVYYGAIKEF
jgi:hypothetical protein